MRQAKLQLPKAWLNVCLVLACGLPRISGVTEIHTLITNCNKISDERANYTITKDIVYQVKADKTLETTTNLSRTCEMTFKAEENTGHLCLVQDYPTVQIADKTAKLEAFDGLGGNHIFSVAYSEYWDATEVCTQSRYINLFLSNGNSKLPVDIGDITINLRVMHISSHSRRIDMAYDTCEKTFVLDHSQISVYNRQMPQDIKGREPIGLKFRCQVHIERLSSSDRNICIVYIPQGKPDCGSKWAFYVLKERNSLATDNILYKMGCSNPKGNKTQAWCAPSTTDHVTLVHWRNIPGLVWSNDSRLERPEQYRVVLTDFKGGDLNKLLKQVVPKKTGPKKTGPKKTGPKKTVPADGAENIPADGAEKIPRNTTVPQNTTQLPRSNAASFNMAWWILLAVGVGLLSECTHLRLL